MIFPTKSAPRIGSKIFWGQPCTRLMVFNHLDERVVPKLPGVNGRNRIPKKGEILPCSHSLSWVEVYEHRIGKGAGTKLFGPLSVNTCESTSSIPDLKRAPADFPIWKLDSL